MPEAEQEKQAGDIPGCFCCSEPENIQTQVGSEHQQFWVPDVGRALVEDIGPESNKCGGEDHQEGMCGASTAAQGTGRTERQEQATGRAEAEHSRKTAAKV